MGKDQSTGRRYRGMKYNNKFEDGETVIIKHTGERGNS
ncbi:protein of unknown function [Paenibacillus alvei]|uniref:Uncharacterized protein n=1 Tax=Paenibacillus alvei TaxID=44250 RepID=A0A383RMY2_PAEAL|nr:protein of unknown function [Paenibacillus alvei]